MPPVPVGDDHRFGPESHVFGLLNEQGGVGGSREDQAEIRHSIAQKIVSFTVPETRRSRAVKERLGMTRDPADDLLHPALPEGHPLRPHVLNRVRRGE
jgi:hypothetical protein